MNLVFAVFDILYGFISFLLDFPEKFYKIFLNYILFNFYFNSRYFVKETTLFHAELECY